MSGRAAAVRLLAVVALLLSPSPVPARAASAPSAAPPLGPATPPRSSVGPAPIGDTPAPPPAYPVPADPTVLNGACLQPGADAQTDGLLEASESWAQHQLDYEDGWRFGRGEGQRVAVIDTGVNPNARLRVVPGGDYLDARDQGTLDCDAHGSLVAAIIGAAPDPAGDTFAGVAPGAEIFTIRQYSARYTVADPARAPASGGYGDVLSLARAVVWAADQGSGVINISEAACGPAGRPLAADDVLGAALRWAVDVRDAVVVAAAGNAPSRECGPGNDPSGREPPTVVASPAWWDDYVLTVGSVDADGTPSPFTLAGPWVDVAAPGSDLVSLNPVAGPPLINRLIEPGGSPTPIQGTSFAAPYVSGTAALVRQRFPALSARQVMNRIEATARPPAGGWNPQVGHGTVDPVAAVSAVLPADVVATTLDAASAPVAPTPPVGAPSTTPRTVAFAASAGALGVLVVAFAVLAVIRRRRRTRILGPAPSAPR